MPAIQDGKFLERLLIWLTPLKKDPPELIETINDAKRAWKQALDNLNHIDNTFVDYAIHNISATERRYMALVQQAKREGLAAWPEYLNDPVWPSIGANKRNGKANPKEAVNLAENVQKSSLKNSTFY